MLNGKWEWLRQFESYVRQLFELGLAIPAPDYMLSLPIRKLGSSVHKIKILNFSFF